MTLSKAWRQLRLEWRLLLYRIAGRLGLSLEEALLYVGAGEALPPPLTHDEESYLLTRLQTGDKAVRGLLIEHNLRLVVYIARKFENTGIAIEDLVSIGTIGLIKAVNTFDPQKLIKLATYASKCIENEILMYLRRNQKTKLEVSFDEPLNVDWDGNELLLSDVFGTDGNVTFRALEEEVDRLLLHRALTRLNSKERRIVELRYGLADGQQRTQKEVADSMGISQSYISRLEKRIFQRLKQEIRRYQ